MSPSPVQSAYSSGGQEGYGTKGALQVRFSQLQMILWVETALCIFESYDHTSKKNPLVDVSGLYSQYLLTDNTTTATEAILIINIIHYHSNRVLLHRQNMYYSNHSLYTKFAKLHFLLTSIRLLRFSFEKTNNQYLNWVLRGAKDRYLKYQN